MIPGGLTFKGATMTGLTAALAAFIHDKTLKDVPPEALDKAKQAIANTFAVILAGASACGWTTRRAIPRAG